MFRDARREDVPAIVALLADDALGAGREAAGIADLDETYWAAFEEIDSDPRNRLIVADCGGAIPSGPGSPQPVSSGPGSSGVVVGTLQLTYLPGLSRRGMRRAQIEAVRIAAAWRGQGLGRQMITWAITQARLADCGLVQLTSDKRRESAIRFYASLGFEASHEGLKLYV